jgi:hypothetical protein
MPHFRITQYELHTSDYVVDADNEAAAIAKLLNGEEYQYVDGSLEYVEVAHDVGMPAERHPELAEAVAAAGISDCTVLIPSIHQICRCNEEGIPCQTNP